MTYYRTTETVDGTMDSDVAAAVRQNAIHAEQIRQEARRRMPLDSATALATAETHYRAAVAAAQYTQQPPPMIGDVREQGLQRLDWQTRRENTQSALAQAEQALGRARRVFAAAELNALERMLREAEAEAERHHHAILDRAGGAIDAKQANAILASDPHLAGLMRDERSARTRVAEIEKAIRLLYP